jgi:hypothetical protein
VVRFPANVLASGIQTHTIEGVSVRITDPAKTIVNLFRMRRRAVGKRSVNEAGVWDTVRPYLEALTVDA